MDALEYASAHRDDFFAELSEFLRIPSVSTQAKHAEDMTRAAGWLRDHLLAAGVPRAEIMPTGGHPVVYAEWMHNPGLPTVLIYGHYDVQPPDPLDLWQSDPFEPTRRGEDLYARGASDDKGQLYVHVKALQAFHETAGTPPVNVKCLFEGEEESGSVNLDRFIEEHRELLAAEIGLISDGAILGPDQPSIVYGLRGIAYVQVEVTGPAHDLHSGGYGGAVLNPINALCAMIAGLHDQQKRITIPGFYDRVRPVRPEERVELAKAPFDRDQWLREAGVSTDWGEAEYSIRERITVRPTLDANGIWGGYTEPGVKTVLPSKAFAKISMRLVPDQDPARITRLITDHLERIAPPGVTVEVSDLNSGKPASVNRESAAMKAAFGAYERGFGREPYLTREGGSIPVVSTLQSELGLDPILMGFGLMDDNLHAPNEKVHLPNLYRGIETSIHFFRLLRDQS
jgi:acetylornithine deacetylase/succinyl-diaminopimelate desuccinylase-like protein